MRSFLAVLMGTMLMGAASAQAMDYQMPALPAGSENRLGAECTSNNASPSIDSEHSFYVKDYTSEQIKSDPVTFRETFSSARDNTKVTVESRGCTDFVLNVKIDFGAWPRNPEPNNMLTSASSTTSRLKMVKDGIFPVDLMRTFSEKMQDMQRAGLTKKVYCLNPSSSGGCSTDVAITAGNRLLEINYIDRH